MARAEFTVVTRPISRNVATGTDDKRYLLGDHRGSTDTGTDAAGVVVERMSFDGPEPAGCGSDRAFVSLRQRPIVLSMALSLLLT